MSSDFLEKVKGWTLLGKVNIFNDFEELSFLKKW